MTNNVFHVFIIPDGNRRFAKSNGLLPHNGHLAGYVALKNILKNIWDHNVTHFTFWALSLDNVKKRTPKEIEYLFNILEKGIKELGGSKEFKERKIRLRFVGNFKDYLPPKTVSKFYEIENKTKNNIGPVFTILLAYDGAGEMCEAIEIVRKKSEGSVKEQLLKNLQTGFLPPVDLMIRTGGEPHLSAGALMWQMQNSHLYFTETLWPDFSTQELAEAIAKFKRRERRYGA